MHLCNENAQIFAADFESLGLYKRIAPVVFDPYAQLSSAEFLTPSEKTVEINLDRLPDEKKRPVWEWIKTNRPALAVLLSQDAAFASLKQQFKTTFNATVLVKIPERVARELGLVR